MNTSIESLYTSTFFFKMFLVHIKPYDILNVSGRFITAGYELDESHNHLDIMETHIFQIGHIEFGIF